LAVINDIQIKDVQEISAEISWETTNDKADEFKIIVETLGSIYQFQNISETKEKFITCELIFIID
jgi:hypothetical protein